MERKIHTTLRHGFDVTSATLEVSSVGARGFIAARVVSDLPFSSSPAAAESTAVTAQLETAALMKALTES